MAKLARAKRQYTSEPGGRIAAGRLLRGDIVPILCLGGYLLVWTALAVAPRYRVVWTIENVPALLFVAALALGYRRLRFSDGAYLQITTFLILHTIGAHFSYGETPIGAWMRALLGGERNPYDRLIHYAFGLLMFWPSAELGAHLAAFRKPYGKLLFGFGMIAASAAIYEIIEWLVVVIAASKVGAAPLLTPSVGVALLASQADPWDAQKDMAVACVGAAMASLFGWCSIAAHYCMGDEGSRPTHPFH